jgi:type 1 glutamine amidotransferase
MAKQSSISRRAVLRTGLTSAGAAIASAEVAATALDVPKKAPGETRVLFLGGDALHNFMAQEQGLRSICEKAGWTFFSVHDARYITAALVSSTDLMMIERWVGGVPGWVPGPIHTRGATDDNYMSQELEDIIVENVTSRGMGFMSIHCTVWALGREKFLDMLGVRPIIHGPLQTVRCQNFNQAHPITRGMKPFDLPIDENFGVEITGSGIVPLYETFGLMDKRQDYGGWASEKNKGRVAGLLAGHTYFAFQNPNYCELFRRAAWWALKRDIPPQS